MRFNIVKEIFKKEILELVRDKKNLFMMFILPILMYPLITVGVSQIMMSSIDNMGKEEIRLLVDENIDEDLYKYIQKNDEIKKTQTQGKIIIYRKNINEDYVKKSIKNEKYDIAIKRESNNKYNVFLDTRSDKANILKERVNKILDSYKKKRVKDKIRSAGLNYDKTLNPIYYESKSVSESQEEASGLIGKIVPFMLIMGILSGAVYPAVDMIAGEKERGTLETLLTMPIKNIELIAGKYLSVAFTAIISTLMNLTSMGLTTYYFYKTASKMAKGIQFEFDMSALILPILITLVSLIIFTLSISAISMCVCSFAKNYKQAQTYLTPLMLVTMVPAYSSMIPMLKLDTTTALIPVVNIVMLIKSIFFKDVSIALAGVVLLSNTAYIAIALSMLAKIFKSENILFASQTGLSILSARKNIKPASIPNISDGILIFAIELVYLITLGSYLQVSYGTLGILMSQVLMLIIVLVYSWYIKVDFKKVFSLNKLNFRKAIYGVLIWFVAFMAMGGLAFIIMKFSPSAKEASEQLNKEIFGKNIILNIITIAMAPAICEELLFRGFILSAFSKKVSIDKKYLYDASLIDEEKEKIMEKGSSFGLYKLLDGDKSAILFSGLLFGILHIYWFKIPTTAILGMFLALGVKKTNTIGTSIIGHFLNNLLALIITTIGLGILF